MRNKCSRRIIGLERVLDSGFTRIPQKLVGSPIEYFQALNEVGLASTPVLPETRIRLVPECCCVIYIIYGEPRRLKRVRAFEPGSC
jgi:hypothetical protein